MTVATGPTAIVVWIPTLRRGAPSNAAGMCGAYTIYRTREDALRHEHWHNQAPWASARKVVVTDIAPSRDADAVCEHILLAELGDASPAILRAAKLVRAGRRVAGVLAWLHSDHREERR